MTDIFDPQDKRTQRTIEDRLRTAYATAMHHGHHGGRVEIHLGSDVIEHLRSICTEPSPIANRRTVWGFPVVDTTASPDHIAVHVVDVIT